MKDSTKAKIDAMTIHELEADVKNARTSPYQDAEKRRYIDERLSILKSERENKLHKSRNENKTDVVDLKPNLFGFGINLNESWRRIKNGGRSKIT